MWLSSTSLEGVSWTAFLGPFFAALEQNEMRDLESNRSHGYYILARNHMARVHAGSWVRQSFV